MQLHDILLLRTSAILPEAISAGGLTPTTDTSLFLTTYRGGSHLPADVLVASLNSVVNPGSYSLERSYFAPFTASPMIIKAVFVILFSFAVCAKVPTVQMNFFSSGQVALYTIAAGVSASYPQGVLGCFNLLPILPLDGGRMLWLALCWRTDPFLADRMAGG